MAERSTDDMLQSDFAFFTWLAELAGEDLEHERFSKFSPSEIRWLNAMPNLTREQRRITRARSRRAARALYAERTDATWELQ